MDEAFVIEGERIYFRPVVAEDAQGKYLEWMNDPEVMQHSESRFSGHTVELLRSFIESMSQSKDNIFFAIIDKGEERHIGNIKLGPIDWNHRRGEVGLLIGEKDCWGKGYGSEAYALMVRYAFENLELHKVTAGAYATNEGSIKALLKAGFLEEGRRPEHCLQDERYVDLLVFGIVKPHDPMKE